MDHSAARGSLLRAYRPGRVALAGMGVALVVSTALPLLGPQLLRRFVDQATAGRPLSDLIGTAIAYLAVALSGQGTLVAASYAASRIAWTNSNRLREDLTAHLLSLDLSFHNQHTPGELMERVDADITLLAEFVSRFLFQILGSALLLLGTVALVFREDPRVGVVLVAVIAAAGVAVMRAQRRVIPFAAAEREAQAQVTGYVEERVAAVEDLRTLGAGDHVVRRFHEASGTLYRADVHWQVVSGGILAVTNLAFALGTAAVVGAGAVLFQRGAITLGTVILLFQYATMVRRPLEQVVQQFKELQEAAAGAVRVSELFSVRPTLNEHPRAQPLPPAGPLDVTVDGVTFAYPGDEPVLHDVSLAVPAGQSLGLVGRTGSGKTSLARLVLRLYDPSDGAVAIAGVDLRHASLGSLRQRVRLVTQDVQVFGASVRDNLTLFGSEGTVADHALLEMLGEVGLGEWLASLPDGLDTELGPSGVGLSAGEAQLLAFARVLVADPGLLVLDEATSRLDPATEALVERAIARLLTGRTAIVIAHRLSSIRRLDRVAVLERGRVVEVGSPDELHGDLSSRFGRLLAVAAEGEW